MVLFFNTKAEAEAGRELVAGLLKELQLSIPKIADDSKTNIVSKSDPLAFLGREVVYLGAASAFVARISSKQVTKIKTKLDREYSFTERIKNKKTFQDTLVDLSRSISAYLGIYHDVYNYVHFADDLRGQSRLILIRLLQELFGKMALDSLSPEGRKFLGIEALDSVVPNPELDV